MDRSDLWADYEQTLETYRQLVDIRFKLLAFLPAFSGVAVTLLSTGGIAEWGIRGLAVLGLLVSPGVIVYDQRNTQFHNGAITRARHLETQLDLPAFGGDRMPGLFGSRKFHSTRWLLAIPIGHDLGLALVYAPVLGAWAFAAVYGGNDGLEWLAGICGAAVSAVAFMQFLWHNGKPERLYSWWKVRTAYGALARFRNWRRSRRETWTERHRALAERLHHREPGPASSEKR